MDSAKVPNAQSLEKLVNQPATILYYHWYERQTSATMSTGYIISLNKIVKSTALTLLGF